MKATYLAAAIVAVAGMSGTAHAAFTGAIVDLGQPPSSAGPAPTPLTGTINTFVSGDIPSSTINSARDPYRGTSPDLKGSQYHVLGGGNIPNSFNVLPAKGEYTFASLFPTLRIHWGSPDDGPLGSSQPYNDIEFFDGTTSVGLVTGADILGASVGFKEDGSAGVEEGLGFAYVALTPTSSFDRVVLSALQNEAFEFSSVAAVPLPAAAWLMIGGLGAIAAYGRRARKTGDVASA